MTLDLEILGFGLFPRHSEKNNIARIQLDMLLRHTLIPHAIAVDGFHGFNNKMRLGTERTGQSRKDMI